MSSYIKPPRQSGRVVWNSSRLGTFCENRSARKVANREYKSRFFHDAISAVIADLREIGA